MKNAILPVKFLKLDEKIYAGFWRRFGAFWVDFFITIPVIIGIIYINNLGRLNLLYTLFPSYLFFFIYHIYFVKLWGATPGKIITKIKIIRSDGIPLGWKEACLRHIIQFVLGILGAIALSIPLINMTDVEFSSISFTEKQRLMIQLAPFWYKFVNWSNNIWIWSEFIVLLLNKRKRALHDYVAGTVVIKKKHEDLAEQWYSEHQ